MSTAPIARNTKLTATDHTPLELLLNALDEVVPGQRIPLEYTLTALVAGGHVLLEGVPGVGKTLIAQAMSQLIDGDFKRIQMTSDLLPSEIIGGLRPTHTSETPKATPHFQFIKGPLFSNVILIDELNRASPRTQSALLEAMAEGHVSVDGQSHKLPDPFFLIATQNPLDSSGTFSLPDSQLDRFMMLIPVGYPEQTAEKRLYQKDINTVLQLSNIKNKINAHYIHTLRSKAKAVYVHPSISEYVYQFVNNTRHNPQIASGVSVRGALQLIGASQARATLKNREFVTPDDIQHLALNVCAHRIILNDSLLPYSRRIQLIKEILESTPAPK